MTNPSVEDRLFLTMWLYTYNHFLYQPEQVIEFIEHTFELTNPFERRIGFVCLLLNRRKEVRKRLNRENWQWVRKELKEGTIGLFCTYNLNESPSPQDREPNWVVDIISKIRSHPRAPESTALLLKELPSKLGYTIEIPRTETGIDGQLQNQFTRLARVTFVAIGGVYGFVNLTRVATADGVRTEYERTRGIDITTTSSMFRDRIRGAFWENYISSGHIERLGGVAAVVGQAPCRYVEKLYSDGSALALRLTESVNAFSPEQVKRLEEYFTPLSPPARVLDHQKSDDISNS